MEKIILHTISSDGPFRMTPVRVECLFRRGIPGLQLSGLSAGEQRETAERIRSALYSCGFPLPYRSITVNLAPADGRKKGSQMDFAIALSILLHAQPEIRQKMDRRIDLDGTLLLGELSLYGDLRPPHGLYGFLETAISLGFRGVCLPHHAGLSRPDGIQLFAIRRVTDLFEGRVDLLEPSPAVGIGSAPVAPGGMDALRLPDRIRRALCVSAAGWHSMLLLGPPGSGKSSCAREMIHLLADPDEREALELLGLNQRIYGGAEREPQRPVRAPHHTITSRALIGGGVPIEPGEATKAHNGVLILEELGEYRRSVLQSLREAVENRCVHIARGASSIILPSRFLLIATTNPCPCGNLGSGGGRCLCTRHSIDAYRRKIEGPLRDRIDMELFLDRIDQVENSLSHAEMIAAIGRAVSMQRERYASTGYRFNGDVELNDLDRFCPLPYKKGTETMVDLSRFSHRVIHSVRKTARTVADLSGSEQIREEHFLEALSYRSLNLYEDLCS
jgi:magnesium chelatase family protein